MLAPKIDWETLGDGAFRLAGEPVAVAANAEFICVAGTVHAPQWGAVRAAQDGNLEHLGNRVTVFDRRTLEPVILERVGATAHDVALDPTGDFLVIATGDYDGGWTYGGRLLVLDLRTQRCSPILDESREFNRLTWAEGGDLMVEVSPYGDEDPDGYRRIVLRQPDLRALMSKPAPLPVDGTPFESDWDAKRGDRMRTATAELTDIAGADYEVRVRVWDAHVSEAGVVTDCLTDVVAEQWDVSGARTLHVAADSVGGQIAVTGERVIAWTVPKNYRDDPTKWWVQPPGNLFVIDGAGGEPRPAAKVASADPSLLVTNSRGQLMLRPTRDPGGRDMRPPSLILDDVDAEAAQVELTGYDLFNHHFVVRNAPDLLAIVSTAGKPHENRAIARVTAGDGVEVMYPLEWDPSRGAHLQPGFGVVVVRGASRMLVHTAHLVAFQRLLEATSFIVCRDYESGTPLWEAEFDSQCSGVVQHGPQVVAAFVSGELAAVDAITGEVNWRLPLHVDGKLATPLSLAAAGAWLAVGLADGRVLRAHISTVDEPQLKLN